MHQHDYAEIERSLAAFVQPGDVFEIRLLHKARKRTDSGYFDHPSRAAAAIAALEEPYLGIYFTPNPVVPEVAARAFNRINAWAQITSLDGDVMSRNWLLIDVDPDRASGISSTDAELDNSFKVARRIANTLELEGWPRPYINASGNGCHLMYAIAEQNTDFVRDEIHKFLKCLNARFKGEGCSVDQTVFNAARIFRVPGTWARKGDNVPVRPHRKAHMVQEPTSKELVPLSLICKFNSANQHLLNEKTLAPGTTKHKSEYPQDERRYRSLNEQAMHRLKEWVPLVFPTAREYKEGFRVTSADLGLDYEEDLTIHPWPLGIKYFGVSDQGDGTEGRRQPVGLVAELVYDGDKAKAAEKIGEILQTPTSEFSPLMGLTPVTPDLPIDTSRLPGSTGPKVAYDFSKIPSLATLQSRTFKEQKWAIRDVLPVGCHLLAARPKMRKTFLALQLGLAIAQGTKFLGWNCEQGDVLFLGLEDNERRIRSRIKLLTMFDFTQPDLSGFRYWTGGVDISPTGKEFISNPEEAERAYAAFPKGTDGVDALDKFLDTFPKTKLIVIDTYARFRESSNNRDVYQRDYDQMMPITSLAARREVCILVVHHEKKGLASSDSGDFMEDVSGTSGITGAVDGIISIKGRRGSSQEGEERKLMMTGRDMPRDLDIDMKFDAQRGGWLTAARQDVQSAVLTLLTRHSLLNQQEIKGLLSNTSGSRVTQVLAQMKIEGLIVQHRNGYMLPRDFKGEY